MPCTIRPQTVLLQNGLRLKFIEEHHAGAPSTSVVIVDDGIQERQLRFDARGDLKLIAVARSTTPQVPGGLQEVGESATEPAPS